MSVKRYWVPQKHDLATWVNAPISLNEPDVQCVVLASDYDALKAAFLKYGAHTADCQHGHLPTRLRESGAYPCDCGFAAALAAADGAKS